ncbi:cyclase family protein [Allorhodopirellula solitaria]|uniref:Kynurenine formamidase n=1 Tax=Allorhodopirellula solitaria TaxID=2527987 RepID=A0A5C5XWE8_9BACT|nr:cyclase family protein [Allorhodopirellula solitaria]TWT67250.1 Kynurenine formamidase [Allorhodopirellula solitaria]
MSSQCSVSQSSSSPNHRNGLLIGAGYFSEFHLDAWQRTNRASIVAVCDRDEARANAAAEKFGIQRVFTDVSDALAQHDIDFVDIATGPTDRLELIEQVVQRRLPIICQKPLANDFSEATQILDLVSATDITFMVHENFRFQPWYREIHSLLESGVIGRRVHTITMRTRMGDGWGDDAYLGRQPYFRTMPRLLVHETGVHFIDTFRYLAGEVTDCSAELRRLNEVIAGEDACLLRLQMDSGVTAVWDANRYNEPDCDDPRYTFGRLSVEADGGAIALAPDGVITIAPLGKTAYRHDYTPPRTGFAGDCVFACQEHFLEVLDGQVACETSPAQYRRTLQVVEAAYESNRLRQPVSVAGRDVSLAEASRDSGKRDWNKSGARRVIDLSLKVTNEMPGVEMTPCKTIPTDGWNATTLSLYSHAGTHMDAPRHFLPSGQTLDAQDLSVCCGVARLVNLPDTAPRHLITVSDVVDCIGEVFPGDRLIFRTDWHRRFGTAAYRDELPRISIELAEWLVEKAVSLIGVEPPSVADVNNPVELTDVHQTLFRGGVVIVEGLANLNQIKQSEFEFIALPLNLEGGDGCPLRAIAIVDQEGAS